MWWWWWIVKILNAKHLLFDQKIGVPFGASQTLKVKALLGHPQRMWLNLEDFNCFNWISQFHQFHVQHALLLSMPYDKIENICVVFVEKQTFWQ